MSTTLAEIIGAPNSSPERQYSQQIMPAPMVMLPSGMTQLAAEAIKVYWAESNRQRQLTLQLQHAETVSKRSASLAVSPSPGLMQWVLFAMIIGCYLVSRTDSTIGLLLRTFSSFMFP